MSITIESTCSLTYIYTIYISNVECEKLRFHLRAFITISLVS